MRCSLYASIVCRIEIVQGGEGCKFGASSLGCDANNSFIMGAAAFDKSLGSLAVLFIRSLPDRRSHKRPETCGVILYVIAKEEGRLKGPVLKDARAASSAAA